MTTWPPRREEIRRPAYRSLARILLAAIESGQLSPGDRLPTHRELAWRLGLSVQTVSRAYDELIRSDILVGEVGRGTFVRAGPPAPGPPFHRIPAGEAVVDCSMLTPVTGPPQERALSRTLAEMADAPPADALASFRPRRALAGQTAKAAAWLGRCGLHVAHDRIVSTNGATPAMTLALMCAAPPGSLILAEPLTHHTLAATARYLGLRVAAIPADGEGADPDAVAAACRAQSVAALYVMPAGLNPRACVMGAERRAALAEVAGRHGLLLVENDAWGPLERDRLPPLAAIAPERTFYFTGLSKCLMPGLRIGWLVVPEAHAAAAAARSLAVNWMATALMAEIAARWIGDGTAASLLEWQRRALQRRQRLVSSALAELDPGRNAFGLHVWLPLPPDWREADFVAAARHRGIAVAAGEAFAAAPGPRPSGVRVCLGGPEEAGLGAALGQLAQLAAGRAATQFLAI